MGQRAVVLFEGLRTGIILKEFQKEQKGRLLENHRLFGLIFPGKVGVRLMLQATEKDPKQGGPLCP